MILNSNSRSLFGAVNLMPDDMDEAIRFAHFIQIYMEKEELSDMSEFEKCRSKEKRTE